MMRIAFFVLVIFFGNFAVSAYGESPSPAIRLPASVMPVSPSPTTELASDAIFVIECDAPCLVLASRTGFVSIVEEAGPLRIRGRFADGGKVESRTYKAKQIWIVEAATAGEVELLIVPVGVKEETSVIRRTLIVGGIAGSPKPQPPKPQDPVDPIGPKPDPLPSPLGLDKAVANAVRLNVPASERAFAAKLAENYRVAATNIANGSWPVEQAIKKLLDLNTRTAGYKADVWRPVFKNIADVLADARDQGKFTATQKDYVAMCMELSLAFAEVAK